MHAAAGWASTVLGKTQNTVHKAAERFVLGILSSKWHSHEYISNPFPCCPAAARGPQGKLVEHALCRTAIGSRCANSQLHLHSGWQGLWRLQVCE